MKLPAERDYRRGGRRRRGTALVMIILVSVILTGLVMAISWSAGVQSEMTGASVHLDQANNAAESAGQWAVWKFKNDNTWRQTTVPTTLPSMVVGSNTFQYGVTCVDAGSSATLYWPFNEGVGTTTADTSGHGNTGTLTGGVTWIAGKYSNALAFDGATGYVDAGNNASTNITSNMTMAAWVNMDSAGQDQKVGGNQDGTAGGYKLTIYGLQAEFEVRAADNTPTLSRGVAGGTILTVGTWYHVAGVYNTTDGTIKTYVNGVLDRTVTGVSPTALASTTGNFIMGREPWNGALGTTRFFSGDIDDVRVYNRALSAQEIQTLANTSVHVHALATQQTTGSSAGMNASTSVVDFIASAPSPIPPIAPALTVGGNLNMQAAAVSGDVQVSGKVTGSSASTVLGHLTYGKSYSDPKSYITITLNGATGAATKNSSATVPTINYTSIQAQAPWTGTAGTGQTYTFAQLYNGQIPIIYVNGDVTDPVVDTSQSGGTLLINGKLTLTKAATFGSPGFPCYIITEGNVTQSGGAMSLTGALYVKGTWTHTDVAINGDVCVSGNVTDNTATTSSYEVGGIPWFDPRANVAATPQPLFYASYEGAAP